MALRRISSSGCSVLERWLVGKRCPLDQSCSMYYSAIRAMASSSGGSYTIVDRISNQGSGRSLPLWGSSAVLGLASVAAMTSTMEADAENTTPEENPYSLKDLKPSGKLPDSITLYQYEVCPFCCKVKAFLDLHKLPYRVVEVDPLGKSELKWSEYKKVPVVLLDGSTQLNNSSSIISQLYLELKASEGPSSHTKTWSVFSSKNTNGSRGKLPDESMIREEWRRWVDEKFVRAITVNIYRTANESFQTFDYITTHGNFGWAQRQAARIVGATMMWSLSNRLKKKYGIEGDVRQALYALAEEWAQGLNGQPFMGGEAPSLADIEAFGVIRSITGTDTFHDLQHNTNISPWYERMMKEVGDSSRLSDPKEV